MKNLVVLPTYNESENIEELCQGIAKAVPEIDILIIDDSSPDGTGQIAERLSQSSDHVKVIHRMAKSGRGSATVAGFKHAIDNDYDFVIEMDCDLSHDPSELPNMLANTDGSNLVIASRFVEGGYVEGWNSTRKLIHWAADMAVKLILGTPNTDHTNGFRCYRVETLKKINLERMGFGYIGQTLLENLFFRLGFIITEVPTTFKNREHGVSKMGKKEMIDGIKAMLHFRKNIKQFGLKYYLA